MARKPPIEKYTGLLAQPINAKRWRLPKVEPGLSDTDREKWPELHTAAIRHPDPHFVRTLETIAGQRRRDEAIEAMLKPEFEERWTLLFAHFELENEDWQGIARCLAGAHVPGFQVQRTLELQSIAGVHHRQPGGVRRQKELNFFGFRIVGKIRGGGENKVWDNRRLVDLYGDYIREKRPGNSDRDVLKRLLKGSPWSDKKKRSIREFEKSASASKESALRTLQIKLNQAKALQGAIRIKTVP
jgi:hypothetical protein